MDSGRTEGPGSVCVLSGGAAWALTSHTLHEFINEAQSFWPEISRRVETSSWFHSDPSWWSRLAAAIITGLTLVWPKDQNRSDLTGFLLWYQQKHLFLQNRHSSWMLDRSAFLNGFSSHSTSCNRNTPNSVASNQVEAVGKPTAVWMLA